ncbi:MAG: hypothetical protein IPG44_18790 [Anaerolineales bacterium]|nr:hypothetical protein [Anaerolineales bacterium]
MLTADGDLIGYSQQNSKKGNSKLPVAIHSKDWLLFLRPWLPRNDDYDKIFIDLVFSEKIQSYAKFSPIVIDQVVRILSSYENITPQVAAEILADFDFTKQIQNIQKRAEQEFREDYEDDKVSENEKESIIQDIIAEKTAKLINHSLTKLIDQKEKERATTSLEKTILTHVLEKEEKQKTELQTKLNNQSDEITGLKEKVNSNLEDIMSLNSQVNGLADQNKLLANNLSITKWGLGILIGLLLILGLNPIIQDLISSFANEKIKNAVTIIIFIFGVTIPFGIGLGMKKTWKIITIIDVIVSLGVVLWNAVD